MKIRVLHVINNLNLGGAETLLANWLPILQRDEDFEVHVLVLSKNVGTDVNVLKLNAANIIIHTLGLTNLYSPKALPQLYSFFKHQLRFDVVHAHLFPTFYWLALIKPFLGAKKTKFIFTEHSTKNKRINNKKYYPIEHYIYNRYDYIIAISDAVYQKITNWVVRSSKVLLIKNGLEINTVASSNETSLIEQKDGRQNILMVARFVESKDHVGLLRALKILKANSEIQFHLYLAGDGIEKEKVAKIASEYELTAQVSFLGYVADARSLMDKVALNVLCSRYEGFSGVTIESIFANKPFIGANVDGIKEIVADSNSLYEYGNDHDLFQKIKNMLTDEDLATKSIKTNYDYALQFDIHHMVKKHIACYKELAGIKESIKL